MLEISGITSATTTFLLNKLRSIKLIMLNLHIGWFRRRRYLCNYE